MNKKSVIEIVDYGKIEVRLKDILDEKNLSRSYLARVADTRFDVIKKWCDNNVEKMDLDVLARICHVLECKPSDIIKYERDRSSECNNNSIT